MSAATVRVAPVGLAALTRRRHEVAREWVCRLVHGVEGCAELLDELVELEARIANVCPRQAPRLIRQWVQQDACRIHDPAGPPVAGCRYCLQVAMASLAV